MAYAAERGIASVRGKPLTGRRLKRWRSYGVMPPRQRRGIRRAEGVLVRDHPIAGPQLVALCRELERVRALWAAAATLWHGNYYVPSQLVRDLIVAVYTPHRQRRPGEDYDEIADTAYAEARASVRGWRDADRREAKRLSEAWEAPIDHGEARLSEREALVSARTQLNQAMHGTDASKLDAKLLTSMHRFDQFDRLDGAPQGYSEQNVTLRVAAASDTERVLGVVRELTGDDLAGLRWWLRQWWERVTFLRCAGRPEERDWARQAPLHFDPREAGYNPRSLLIVAGQAASQIAEFHPDFFASTQVKLLR